MRIKIVLSCAAVSCFIAAGTPARAGRIDYNAIANAFEFKRDKTFSDPLAVYRRAGGGGGFTQCERLGALAWELDSNSNKAMMVWGHTFPGVRHGGHYASGSHAGMHNIYGTYCLGAICPPGAEHDKPVAAERNWTTWKYIYEYDCAPDADDELSAMLGEKRKPERKEYAVTASRLTPAILVECSGCKLDFFSSGLPAEPRPEAKLPGSPVKVGARNDPAPLFFARPVENRIAVFPAEELERLPTQGLADSWLLVWWGPFAPTIDTQNMFARHGRPLCLRDVPVLFAFELEPDGLSLGPGGGIRVSRDGEGGIGKVALMPLFGDIFPLTAEWSRGLPDEVAKKAEWWARRMRQYPVKAEETYSWDGKNDFVRLEWKYEYAPVGKGGVKFAPLPPMLSLAAKYGFPVRLPENISDSGYVTMIGPHLGVDSDSVACEIAGLGKYADERLVPGGPAAADAPPANELAHEADKILRAGALLAPAIEMLSRGFGPVMNPAPGGNPGDNFFFLAQCLPYLDAERRAGLLAYLHEIGQEYPPDRPGWVPYTSGVERINGGPLSGRELEARRACLDVNERIWGHDFFFDSRQMIPPENWYGLAAYLDNGGKWDSGNLSGRISDALQPYLAQTDWALLGWARWKQVSSHGFGLGCASDVNRWFNGLLGVIRLARRLGDAELEARGRYLFAKAAALRFAQAKFVRYFYDTGRLAVPADPRWDLNVMYRDWVWSRGMAGRETAGDPRIFDWRSADDDVRQVVALDEFGPTLAFSCLGNATQPILTAFNYLTPELGRFLCDQLRAESAKYVEQALYHMPGWEIAFYDAAIGSEHSFLRPENAFQLFAAQAWILGASPQYLEQHLDIPWVEYGDYFYMVKLAAAIQARRGLQWEKLPQLAGD